MEGRLHRHTILCQGKPSPSAQEGICEFPVCAIGSLPIPSGHRVSILTTSAPCRVSRLVQTHKEGKMHPDTVMSQPQASPSARRGRPLKRFHSGKTPGKPHTNRNEKSTGTSEEPTKIQHLAHKRCNRPDVDCGLFRALGDPELSRAQNTSGHQLPRFFNPIRSKNASQSHKRPKILRQFGPIGEKEPQDGLKALVSREDPFGSLKEPKQDGPNASSRRKPSAPGNSFGAIGRYSAATWQYGVGKTAF